MGFKLEGTKTRSNLLAAFAGETQAYMRYTLFAAQAKKEGFEQINAIFLETAENERHHAKIYWSFLSGGLEEFTARFPAGATENTLNNLRHAAAGEEEEGAILYPAYAQTAREEGLEEIAEKFYMIANIELTHRERYDILIQRMEKQSVFRRPEAQKWLCLVCGHCHLGVCAPDVCPVCGHPQGFFEIKAENY